MNFAFAFFHPSTFQITPMDANAGSLIKDFINLKESNRALQTWISVGGWSFNDPGNNPDTRTAFSDMASSSGNRGKFIASLLSFMRNHGFDGVDLDWEYPAADDRGGKEADTANYVSLVKEMKAAFGLRYGLTVTLPASFWYLRHFDVKAMQPYVDWFNIMTYDIHGTFTRKHQSAWSKCNRCMGFIEQVYRPIHTVCLFHIISKPSLTYRPHTNLTEIDEGLSLLWRAGVSASNVVMGLGFYGRSFKLSSPSCNKPGCTFSSGATAGACTGASGILSLAEIDRTIKQYSLTASYDAAAAVKWITWNSDQWVSYDDDQTFKQKSDYARDLGLSGTMVWAVDQAATGSNDAYFGAAFYQKSSGLSKKSIAIAQTQLDAQSSCYTSFCGKGCAPGYSPDGGYETKGRVGELGVGSECKDGETQQICCKTGTIMGKCRWYGYRGKGLSCYGGQCPQGDTLIVVNSNSYFNHPEVNIVEDHTCNGGSQIYCCRGFMASMQLGRDAELLQAEDVESGDAKTLAKRDFKTCLKTGLITDGVLVASVQAVPVVDLIADVLGVAAAGIITVSLSPQSSMNKIDAPYEGSLLDERKRSSNQQNVRLQPSSHKRSTRKSDCRHFVWGKASATTAQRSPQVGFRTEAIWPVCAPQILCMQIDNVAPRWALKVYTASQTGCQVTYTCKYGRGFDQVCDNQKYGIDKVMGGVNVFSYDEFGNRQGRVQSLWAKDHNKEYRSSFGPPVSGGGRNRCEIDEFPLGSLRESANYAAQALRALDGNENGKQGIDWQQWLLAEWYPCSTVLKAPPPITWSIGDPPAGDSRTAAAPSKTIARYGFDSVSGKAQCWPTYSFGSGPQTVIRDHGFRVGHGDPLFGNGAWPAQDYKEAPRSAGGNPTNVNSAAFVKKRWGMEMWEFGDMTIPTKTAEATLLAEKRDSIPTDGAIQVRQQKSPTEDQPDLDTAVQNAQVGTDPGKATITPPPTVGHEAHLKRHAKGVDHHGHGL
ncbi:MAG: hypothetical protein Q9215_004928 [Flavoplaca cf. flavocitrina]